MAFRNDDVTVKVGADTYDLERGMVKGRKSVRGFDVDVSKMAVTVAKVGATAALALGGIAVAAAGMARNAATAAKEIQNLSRLSGVGAEQFQRYAVGAKSVGIEQEKLADIFKDVNDKFGDFLETGAGPLADFFENIAPAIGVTAEQFARLSGPEALQLYVDSLEKAGVSQQRMTFYLEALASDATGLLPLLQNNGAAMKSFGDEASRTGRILSDEAVASGAELDDKLTEIADTLKGTLNQAILENADEIIALTETIMEDWVPALVAVAGFIGEVIAAIASMVSEIGSAMGAVVDFGATVADTLGIGAETTGSSSRRSSRGQSAPVLPPPEEEDPDANDPRNGIYGDFSSDYDANVEAEEQAQADALARLMKFREEKERIENEADAARKSGASKSADDLLEIERRLQAAKVSTVQGAFGDLASLMGAESEKLFKIGQLAAVAEATVSGGSAAVAAWDKGMKVGGPPVAAAFAGASLAKTGALIAGMKSQKIGGGLSGGSGAAQSGVASASAAAAPQERQVAEFRFTGGNLFDPAAIVDAINEAYDRGYSIKAVQG